MRKLSGTLSKSVQAKPQIAHHDIVKLAASGVTLVICHRPDGEDNDQPPFSEIAEAAQALGITALHVPIIGLPALQAVEATGRALAAMGPNDKALLYCRSGMRSAAAWAMAERLRGVDADELRAAAAAAGYDLSRLPL